MTDRLPIDQLPRVALWERRLDGQWSRRLSAENLPDRVRHLRSAGKKLLEGGTIAAFEVREYDFEGRERVLIHQHRV